MVPLSLLSSLLKGLQQHGFQVDKLLRRFITRAGQIDNQFLLDSTRTRRKDEHAITEQNGFLYVVRDEQDRGLELGPHAAHPPLSIPAGPGLRAAATVNP